MPPLAPLCLLLALLLTHPLPSSSTSSSSTSCDPHTRSQCHNRGTCSSSGDSCACDDPQHYWSSEQCSTEHPGPELEEEQCCKPDTTDAYCSYLGTCHSSGLYCECRSAHYWAAERCATWHSEDDLDPDPQPATCPPPPVFSPTASPTEYTSLSPTVFTASSPTSVPSTLQYTACNPDTRAYCNDRGTCSSSGDSCACDDPQHYWSSEQCSTEHPGPELEEGQCCKPDTTDAYCSYLGTCHSSGQYCNCTSDHFWAAERCASWHHDADPDPQPATCPPVPVFSPTTVPTAAPTATVRPTSTPSLIPTKLLTTCNPGTRAYCNNRGTCSAAGDVCECDDALHYWPSELCSTEHPGPELEEGQCCKPGMNDAYCSYLGTCHSNGLWCICPTENFWAREGCSTWHEEADPDPEPELCPGVTYAPSIAPSQPSSLPSAAPTSPTATPSLSPSGEPSSVPTIAPSAPSAVPSAMPTSVPSSVPTAKPSDVPSSKPSGIPTSVPSGVPTVVPTGEPSTMPSCVPTSEPTQIPTGKPSGIPTNIPTSEPSTTPSVVPTGEPSGVPSCVPTGVPSIVPSAVPSAAPTYCIGGDRSFCNNNGVCSVDNSGCECDDPLHYWPSEHCVIFHDGPELQTGLFCSPDERNYYCSWLGDCASDGLSCNCDDPGHRLSSDRCKTWTPPPPTSTGLCVAGDRSPCNNKGTCDSSSGSNVCVCDDPYHYWASEMCSIEHFGGQLAPGDCCIPGKSDYYCSWMGTCDSTGGFCVCNDASHRWGSERCLLWHETADPSPPSQGSECPQLMFDDTTTTRSANQDLLGMSTGVFYSVMFVGLAFVILGVVVMRRRFTIKEEQDRNSSFSFDDAVGTGKKKSIFDVKSPYLAEVAAESFDKGIQKANSFIRGSSFGYSDVSGEKDSMFGMDSPYVTAQQEEEIEMTKPSNFSYEDMAGKDSMFEMKSPLEEAREEDLLELGKPSNFSYDDVVRQSSAVFSTENSLHAEANAKAQALVVHDESEFGVNNQETSI